MRKTKLMELAEAYGDEGFGMLSSSTIDPIVYMISELAESAFGPEIIRRMVKEISLTNGGFGKKKALEILTNDFLKIYLMGALISIGKQETDKYAKTLKDLPDLNDKSYVDYFVLLTTINQHFFRTKYQKACVNVESILAGYQVENAYAVCDGIVTFFKETKNPHGLMRIITKLCTTMKDWSRESLATV